MAERPGQFEVLLGQVDPTDLRDALLTIIENNRNHLQPYPASCSARIHREETFEKLYNLKQEKFQISRKDVDKQYRLLEDDAFPELTYEKSKTCCWNSSTSAMHQIIMDYNAFLLKNQCVEPVGFFWNTGYSVFEQCAQDTGRTHQWRP